MPLDNEHLGEQIRNIDQAHFTRRKEVDTRFELVEDRVGKLEDRAKGKSEKLDAAALEFATEIGTIRKILAVQAIHIKYNLWILIGIGVIIAAALIIGG